MPNDIYNDDGYTVSSFDNILKNLYGVEKRQSALREISMAHIKDLALEMLKMSDFDMTEKFFRFAQRSKPLKDIYAEIKTAKKQNLKSLDVAEINRKSVCDFCDCMENEKLICLSSEIKKQIALRGGGISPEYFFGEDSEAVSAEAHNKTAYLKNVYTDIAYEKFKKIIPAAEAMYYDNFSDICDEVISGNCEYCIIPTENSDDGKLMGFYNLIKMYELKIVLSVNVAHPDGNKSTSFALAKKSIENAADINYNIGTDKFFEICLVSDSMSGISEVLRAAECFGMKLHKIDSSALAYSENKFEYYIVWKINDADLYSFLIYMSVKDLLYDPIGVYAKIK